jgi:prepilin-type N-terminal cleavage/methylation domain-containing protein
MTSSYHKKQGFTLIELLVVISIIALLSSVVLSSLAAAKQKAQDAKVVADLRQLKNAMELRYSTNGQYYGQDYFANASSPDYLDFIGFGNTFTSLVTEGYISKLPPGSLGDIWYAYLYVNPANNTNYCGTTPIKEYALLVMLTSSRVYTALPKLNTYNSSTNTFTHQQPYYCLP